MNRLFKNNTVIILSSLIFLFFLTALSCDNDDDVRQMEQAVTLNVESTTLNIGEELIVKPSFTPNVRPQKTYSWVTSNPTVVGIEMNEDYSAIISANKKGTSIIKFSSSDGELEASLDVTVNGVEDDGVLKVLAIGNSFSEDAIENYLHELASAENVSMVIGNLFLLEASLETHWANAQNNAGIYDYRKIDKDGIKTNTIETSIETAVKDENWDYISFQQLSNNSGQYETFVIPLPDLIEYVKERSTNPESKFILHQTWAYSKNSTHSAFSNYGSNQEVMYEAIVNAMRKAKIAFGMDYVIPTGTAIQNGRSTLIGDNFNRDGHHLNLEIGRYTAASTWFEALTSISVIGNSFKPDGLSNLDAEIAQHSAHASVLNPDKVTLLSDYAEGGAQPLEANVMINFGNKIIPKWNTLSDYLEGSSIPNLKDVNDQYTNIELTVVKRFSGINESGEGATNTDFNMTSDISGQSFYGNSRGVWQNGEIKQAQITLSGLDSNTTYNLCFFGSRSGVGDNRETKFIVSGENTKTVNLQTSNNTSETTCTTKMQPDFNGNISVTVTAGDNNDNDFGFYYLGSMRLSPGE